MKFQVGDRVIISQRCAKYKRQGASHSHKIVEVVYSRRLQATLYWLADNGRGMKPFPFRSYELKPCYPHRGRPKKSQLEPFQTEKMTPLGRSESNNIHPTLEPSILVVIDGKYKRIPLKEIGRG